MEITIEEDGEKVGIETGQFGITIYGKDYWTGDGTSISISNKLIRQLGETLVALSKQITSKD